MASNNEKHVPNKNADYNKGIEEINISKACTEYMKIFGANTNIMRHLPVIYDGLLLGERRLLYTMFKSGNNYNTRYVKVATITGQVLELHPHGPNSVYATLVKMAQPWANIQTAIDGFGNFGDASGESAAADRYIEARLSFYAYKCFFEEFDPDIVDMKWNYSKTKLEPEFLPSRYPNVMINNSFGIGYGISTSICTYNFKEVIEATIELIENPDIDVIVLIPDSPTGASIVDEGQFEEISRTGKGRFKMRGVIEIDDVNNILHIRSTPLQASWINIKKSVFEILTNDKVNLMKDFKDLCAVDKIHYEIHLKKEVDPYSVVQQIYAKTQMEKTCSVNFKLIEDYADNDYNVKSVLQTWIDFRRETKRRLYSIKLRKSVEHQHILEILLFILNKDNAENTLRIIKKSENTKEIISKLVSTYHITTLQAATIADMRLSAFSKEAYKKYIEEKEKIDKDVQTYEKIVKSTKKIDKIIIDELKEGIKLFGDERRSQIINIDNEVKIRDTDHIIIFTKNGLVKKLLPDVKNIGLIQQGDYPIEIIHAKNTSDLLIFDVSGKISKLPVHKIQGTALNNVGIQLNSLCTPNGDITTVKIKPNDDVIKAFKSPVYFLMLTKNGIIKKTEALAYSNIKNEILGLIVKNDDELVCVKLLIGDKDVLVYTKSGYGVRFNTSEIRETSRMSMGVKAIEIGDSEEVVGMEILNSEDKYILPITSKGFGKKCTLDTFKTMSRADKPLRIISLDDSDTVFDMLTIKGHEKFDVYTKDDIQKLDSDEVTELPRLSKGKKLINVRKGSNIVKLHKTN